MRVGGQSFGGNRCQLSVRWEAFPGKGSQSVMQQTWEVVDYLSAEVCKQSPVGML